MYRRKSGSLRAGEEKRSGRIDGVVHTSKELAKLRKLQRKKLSKPGLSKRKEWPQRHKKNSRQGRQSRLHQKEKEKSHQSRSPDRDKGESQSERESRLVRKRRVRAGAWRGQSQL